MPLASELPVHEHAKRSQILSLSLRSHLGNGNLYLQTVGAGAEHEILKSTSLRSPPPSPPGLPALSLPTPPLALLISEMRSKNGLPVVHSLVCNPHIAVSERLQSTSCCIPPLRV